MKSELFKSIFVLELPILRNVKPVIDCHYYMFNLFCDIKALNLRESNFNQMESISNSVMFIWLNRVKAQTYSQHG